MDNRRIAGFLKLDQCKSFNWTNYTTLAWTNQLRSNKGRFVLIFDHMARRHIPWDVQKGCGGENGVCVRTVSESDGGDALHCEAPHDSVDPFHAAFSDCDWASKLKVMSNKNMNVYSLLIQCVVSTIHDYFKTEKLTKAKVFAQARIVFKAKVEDLYPPASTDFEYVIPNAAGLLDHYNTLQYSFRQLKEARALDSTVSIPVTTLETSVDSIDQAFNKPTTQKAIAEETSNKKQKLGDAHAHYVGRTSQATGSSSVDSLSLPAGTLGAKDVTSAGAQSSVTSVKVNASSNAKNGAKNAHDVFGNVVGGEDDMKSLTLLACDTMRSLNAKTAAESKVSAPDVPFREAEDAQKVVALLKNIDVSTLPTDVQDQHNQNLREATLKAITLAAALIKR